MTWLRRLVWLVLALWVITAGALIYEPGSPYEPIGIDTVDPVQVRRGGTITIARSIRIVREQPITVTRKMTRGDCAKSCEIIDLPTGALTLAPGEYMSVKREHILPSIAGPGIWRLDFAVHWEDRFGRSLRKALPPLTVEILS